MNKIPSPRWIVLVDGYYNGMFFDDELSAWRTKKKLEKRHPDFTFTVTNV